MTLLVRLNKGLQQDIHQHLSHRLSSTLGAKPRRRLMRSRAVEEKLSLVSRLKSTVHQHLTRRRSNLVKPHHERRQNQLARPVPHKAITLAPLQVLEASALPVRRAVISPRKIIINLTQGRINLAAQVPRTTPALSRTLGSLNVLVTLHKILRLVAVKHLLPRLVKVQPQRCR